MSYRAWLIQIGKSPSTADKYSRAVTGVISTWAKDAGLTLNNLKEVKSVAELRKITAGLENVKIYKDRNAHGNNMYSCAVNAYIEYRRQKSANEVEEDVGNIISDKTIPETEKKAYISARLGQGKYRNDLIDYWNGCALTGFTDVRFLVASHIKPWRKSDNTERLDPYNGLLLLPNLDKAFDLGFISFTEKGKIIVSDHLEEMDKLGVTRNLQLELDDSHQSYMLFHREIVFEKNI